MTTADEIRKLLTDLGHSRCPHCQADISPERHISRADIEKWVRENQMPAHRRRTTGEIMAEQHLELERMEEWD